MKKIYLLLLLLFSFGFSVFAQQKGISYQAVIINPKAIQAPGYNGTSIPLVNKIICLSFKVVNGANQVEYQESQSIKTDAYGMINVVIGKGTSGTALVANLDAVNWNQGDKKLVVGVNTNGVCANYIEISNQVLNYTPYSYYAQNADLKDGYVTTAKLADGAVTDDKVVMGINPSKVGLGNVNNTSDANKPVSTATQSALNLKANLASPIFTGTVSGIDKTMVGLSNVDNTTDANKPVSTATQTVLNLKANLESPTFTGIVSGINKIMVGLSNVDNTTDVNKPVSTATQTALNLKANTTDLTTLLALKEDKSNKSAATGLGNSDQLYPTQKAVKTYVDSQLASGNIVDADGTTKGKIKLAGDLGGTAAAPTVPGLALKSNISDVTASLALKENLSNKSTTTALGTSNVLYPTQNAVKTYVDTQLKSSTIVDANATTKGKIQLAGDLGGTAEAPTVPGLALKANTSDVTASLALKEDQSNKSTTTTLGTSNDFYPTQNAVKTYVDTQLASSTIVDANATTKGKIQLAGDLGGTAAAPTVPELVLKAPLASPTFTGTVTAPIYASTPHALSAGATITWNPANGLNASVTLDQNSTLSFTATPTPGTYGTLVVSQDATGGRTITLPSTANKVLGSTSTTTIALSSAANAKDILNFYYDGTNCYWNIGQGYGIAATSATTDLATSVSGTLPVANVGTGVTTLTGLVKGNGTGAMTAATVGTDYLAPTGSAANLTNFPTFNQNTTGTAANVTGTVAVANGGTGLSDIPVNGQIDIGNGTGFTRATLTAGTAITISNTAGAITISAAVRPTSDQFTATNGQTSFTLTQTPFTNTTISPNLKPNVSMFINGVRTNNLAYTVSGTTVTYSASDNNSYPLVVGDRVQFDYSY